MNKGTRPKTRPKGLYLYLWPNYLGMDYIDSLCVSIPATPNPSKARLAKNY